MAFSFKCGLFNTDNYDDDDDEEQVFHAMGVVRMSDYITVLKIPAIHKIILYSFYFFAHFDKYCIVLYFF